MLEDLGTCHPVSCPRGNHSVIEGKRGVLGNTQRCKPVTVGGGAGGGGCGKQGKSPGPWPFGPGPRRGGRWERLRCEGRIYPGFAGRRCWLFGRFTRSRRRGVGVCRTAWPTGGTGRIFVGAASAAIFRSRWMARTGFPILERVHQAP